MFFFNKALGEFNKKQSILHTDDDEDGEMENKGPSAEEIDGRNDTNIEGNGTNFKKSINLSEIFNQWLSLINDVSDCTKQPWNEIWEMKIP